MNVILTIGRAYWSDLRGLEDDLKLHIQLKTIVLKS